MFLASAPSSSRNDYSKLSRRSSDRVFSCGGGEKWFSSNQTFISIYDAFCERNWETKKKVEEDINYGSRSQRSMKNDGKQRIFNVVDVLYSNVMTDGLEVEEWKKGALSASV